MRKRKRSKRRSERNSTTHPFANTARRNTHPNWRTNAVSWRRARLLAQQCGNLPKAPGGAQGMKRKLKRGNQE
jgi:hypothetical protein